MDRKVDPGQYTHQKLGDPRVHEIINKVQMEADPTLDRFGRAGITEIWTKRGVAYSRRVEYPKGDPRNPMSDQELEDKFRTMAKNLMSKEQFGKEIATIYEMEKVDDIRKLMETVVFDK